jgi:hypothetical protein
VTDLIERSKHKVIGHHEVGIKFGAPAIGLWNWTLAGLNLINSTTAEKDLRISQSYDLAEEAFINFLSYHR